MSKSAIIALRMKEISLDLISAFKNRENCISCIAPCGITANIKKTYPVSVFFQVNCQQRERREETLGGRGWVG